MNTFKTFVLMFALILLFLWVGQMIAGKQGMITAFAIACIMNFIAYWFSDKIVLSMYGARQITEVEQPQLYSLIANLSQSASLPMPKVYIINTLTPNAFATGRNPQHSAVAVTTGILDILSKRELAGVIAHELSHIKNRDTLISVVAATIAGAIFMLARLAQWAMLFGGFGGGRDERGRGGVLGGLAMIVVMILAPIAAMIIQLAISRSREYFADDSAARLTREPLSLADALSKLAEGARRRPLQANPATAHMFIVNPLRAGGGVLTLFSTHPPISERIRRLENLARQLG
ncbi:MAG: zinc metalloprotease HtpX [Elusimicrobiota bacterium]|nr:zinc metalloprotease HtpX [Elusimicrobiota bacterium]